MIKVSYTAEEDPFFHLDMEEHWKYIRDYLMAGWKISSIARDKNTDVRTILDLAKKNGLVKTINGWKDDINSSS